MTTVADNLLQDNPIDLLKKIKYIDFIDFTRNNHPISAVLLNQTIFNADTAAITIETKKRE